MKRGVLLIALGHPHYGQMAANLAASIKFQSPDMPITLVWAEEALSHLSDQKKALFTELVKCPYEYFHREDGKRVYVKAKTHMYDLSPYDETIFIDADVIMCPDKRLETAFEELKKVDFTMENRSRVNLAEIGPSDTYLWADISDIIAAYKFKSGFLYQLHSEFVYFKKKARIAKFFETVKKEFETTKCKMKHVFDGDIPDEFAFAMAMIKHKLYPHEVNFVPLYWYLIDRPKGTTLEYVHANYYGYSIGGNAVPELVNKKYMQMARAYFYRLGLQHPFKPIPKKQSMPSRLHM